MIYFLYIYMNDNHSPVQHSADGSEKRVFDGQNVRNPLN